MSKTTIARGNVAKFSVIAPSLTPSAVSGTSAEQTFSIPDLLSSDVVHVAFPGSQTAGVGIINARVSASNTLAVTFSNSTGSSATPASGVYNVAIMRCEDTPLPANAV